MPDLASRLAGHSSATALLEGDLHISYGELADRVARTASGIRERGMASGARVAVVADTTVDGVVAYLGAQAAGVLPIMLNPRSPLAELQRRYDEVDPQLTVFAGAEPTALPAGITAVRPVGSSATDYEVLAAGPAPSRKVKPNEAAVVLYTSGVSGLPKPVVLTYANLAATRDGLRNAPGAGLDSSTVAFAGLPIVHVFGLNSIVGTVLGVGGKLVLHTSDHGFDPHEVAELVARYRVTALSVVPLMWKALAAAGHHELFATVTRPTYSAAPMPPSILDVVRSSLGLELAGGFGLTETAGTICHDDPTNAHPGTVGYALGDTQIRVVDDGEDAIQGDVGEVWLRGPSVAEQYLDGTALEMEDGWLRTGDVGMFDDEGRLDIVDRKKDVINIGGFNVNPAEVEVALAMHPAVSLSVVVGDVEDDREVVVAHVVPRPGEQITEAELVAHCQTQLSRYKVPKHVFLHNELPVTESGKAVRRLLGKTA